MTDEPCTAAEAVARLVALLETKTGQYAYGAGDYNPAGLPWTRRKDGLVGGDCRVAFLHAWKVHGTRPGFNRGAWASVADDVNYNSLIEDGEHHRELIAATYRAPLKVMPQPGDLVTYPTFYLPGHAKPWIGHGALVELVPDDYIPGEGWTRLTLLQCHGPDEFSPGIVRTSGAGFDGHDKTWPKDEHHSVLIRPRERS